VGEQGRNAVEVTVVDPFGVGVHQVFDRTGGIAHVPNKTSSAR
jgi:hypothetical protein